VSVHVRFRIQKFLYSSNITEYDVLLGATGVDNGKSGGWCHDMVGAHSVKLHGRTYSFLPPAKEGVGPSGGLSYFTFDSRAALTAHGASRNHHGQVESHTGDELIRL
jgi:hypothetical protein